MTFEICPIKIYDDELLRDHFYSYYNECVCVCVFTKHVTN